MKLMHCGSARARHKGGGRAAAAPWAPTIAPSRARARLRPRPPVAAAQPHQSHSHTHHPTTTPAAATAVPAAPDGFLGRAFIHALPAGPARFYLSWLPGAAAAVGLAGALHAHTALHSMLHLVPSSVLDALPASAALASLHASHPALIDGTIDTAAGLANLLFSFILLPAADALLGREPEAELPPATTAPPPAAGGLLRQAGRLAAATPGHPPVAEAAAKAAAAAAEAKIDAYRLPLWGVPAIHAALLTTGVAAVAPAAHPAATLAAALGVGAWGGIAFTAAHELLHSPHAAERRLADALLATYGYGHWRDGHLAHHRNVGTPHDAATARLGESFFAFLPRCVAGNWRDGVAAAAARGLARARRAAVAAGEDPASPSVAAAGARNAAAEAAGWVAAPAALAIAAGCVGGAPAVGFYAVQALTGVYMLHAVDYVEHYGLVREAVVSAKDPSSNGGGSGGASVRFEKVAPRHSWNMDSLATNAVSFRLQRHSDHHAHAERPYHLLRDVGTEAAPKLPASYPAMMILAQSPALFRAVMDPAVARARARAAVAREAVVEKEGEE
jgi:alkane 1-monooxygenase